ncbi:hypothetical protein BGC31_10195 [Komagataeibacter xylinus]|nr:hypothetical protein BGC31_10195 [Komagataeibacter xylinus]RFP04168.1 hypothetical protein BFX83_08810 [Komagataeibacter xylinus]
MKSCLGGLPAFTDGLDSRITRLHPGQHVALVYSGNVLLPRGGMREEIGRRGGLVLFMPHEVQGQERHG